MISSDKEEAILCFENLMWQGYENILFVLNSDVQDSIPEIDKKIKEYAIPNAVIYVE